MQFAPVSPLQVLTSVLSRFFCLKRQDKVQKAVERGKVASQTNLKNTPSLFSFNYSFYSWSSKNLHFFQYFYLSQCLRSLPLLGRHSQSARVIRICAKNCFFSQNFRVSQSRPYVDSDGSLLHKSPGKLGSLHTVATAYMYPSRTL